VRELTDEDTDLGTLIDIDEFMGKCLEGEIDDSDGYGYKVYNKELDEQFEVIPSDAVIGADLYDDELTHILWFEA
jgi:hypothetical protein